MAVEHGRRGAACSSRGVSSDLVASLDVAHASRTLCSYDHNGVLTGQAGAARTVGTTVAVRELFKRLPVRWGGASVASAACIADPCHALDCTPAIKPASHA